MKLKLKNILESLNPKTSLEEKKSFLQEVERFNEYGSVIYRTEDLRKVAESINALCEKAEAITLEEAQDWFDEVTIKRNIKELSRKKSDFIKTVHEISKMQQRLEALYEEIGGTLSRYFEIKGEEQDGELKEIETKSSASKQADQLEKQALLLRKKDIEDKIKSVK
jgi:hypothetical protein